MTNGNLIKVESIAECSSWSILHYFRPVLSDLYKPLFDHHQYQITFQHLHDPSYIQQLGKRELVSFLGLSSRLLCGSSSVIILTIFENQFLVVLRVAILDRFYCTPQNRDHKASEYIRNLQEKTQIQMTDRQTALQGRDTEHRWSQDLKNAI